MLVSGFHRDIVAFADAVREYGRECHLRPGPSACFCILEQVSEAMTINGFARLPFQVASFKVATKSPLLLKYIRGKFRFMRIVYVPGVA